MVVVSYVAEMREIRMKSYNKGNPRVGGIGVGPPFQGSRSGNGASSVDGLLDFHRAVSPVNKVHPEFLCMAGEIRGVSTYAT